MGSISCAMPAVQLMLDDVGVGHNGRRLVAKAPGVDDRGFRGQRDLNRVHWLVTEDDTWGRVIVHVLYGVYQENGERTSCVKLIPEDMGPGDFDVPDKIWAARSPEPFGEYSASWREQVEAFRLEWPMRIRHLGPADVGHRVATPYGIDGIYIGDNRRYKIFDTAEGRYRHTRSQNDHGSCRRYP